MFAALMEIPGLFVAATFTGLGGAAIMGFLLARLQYLKHFNSVVDEAIKYTNLFGEHAAEQTKVANELRLEIAVLTQQRDLILQPLGLKSPTFAMRFTKALLENKNLIAANMAMVKKVDEAKTAVEAALKGARELEAQIQKPSEDLPGDKANAQDPIARENLLLKATVKILESGKKEKEAAEASLRDKIAYLSALVDEKNAQLAEQRKAAKRKEPNAQMKEDVAVAKEGQAVPYVPLRDVKMQVNWKICGEEVLVPLPQKLSEMGAWAEKWLGDKVVFMPGALKEIEAFDEYQRPERVYIGMLLLLTKQEMMSVPDGDQAKRDDLLKEYSRCLKELGWRDGQTAGDGVDLLPKSFEGVPVNFDRAIKNNSDHQPLRDLRIYYAVDSVRKRVIVGSAPRHL